jgi:transcriptional repressor NrdR
VISAGRYLNLRRGGCPHPPRRSEAPLELASSRSPARTRASGPTWAVVAPVSSYSACYNANDDSPSDMKCPFCGFENDKVVDSRESKEADSIRRRRECLKCGKRFTTYERIDEIPYMVVKKDGRREKFDRQKVLNGLLRACEKRPVPISRLEQIVNEAEGFVIESAERERKTSEVGELIMNRLRRYDKVAYVRFASVYLDFKDVQEFMTELKDLLKTKEPPDARKGAVKT